MKKDKSWYVKTYRWSEEKIVCEPFCRLFREILTVITLYPLPNEVSHNYINRGKQAIGMVLDETYQQKFYILQREFDHVHKKNYELIEELKKAKQEIDTLKKKPVCFIKPGNIGD